MDSNALNGEVCYLICYNHKSKNPSLSTPFLLCSYFPLNISNVEIFPKNASTINTGWPCSEMGTGLKPIDLLYNWIGDHNVTVKWSIKLINGQISNNIFSTLYQYCSVCFRVNRGSQPHEINTMILDRETYGATINPDSFYRNYTITCDTAWTLDRQKKAA